MKQALTPRLVGALHKLPLKQAWAQTSGDRMTIVGSRIATQSVIREAQSLWNEPTLPLILCEEGLNTAFHVSASSPYLRCQVIGSD
jgi:hypothetical protein